MDIVALVLAGGKGSRIELGQEKPLIKVCGVPMIVHVITALRSVKRLKQIIVAVSPYTPKTKKEMEARSLEVIETPGGGYIADIQYAVREHDLDVVLTVPADMPSITCSLVDNILTQYAQSRKPALAVMAPTQNFLKLGINPEYEFEQNGRKVSPLGINVIDGKMIHHPEIDQEILILEDEVPPINVNTIEELRLAESQFSQYLTARTKALAHFLGADLVGITSSENLPKAKNIMFGGSDKKNSFVVSAYSFQRLYHTNKFDWHSKILDGWESKGI